MAVNLASELFPTENMTPGPMLMEPSDKTNLSEELKKQPSILTPDGGNITKEFPIQILTPGRDYLVRI